ncbi:hypothetical protein [Roseibium algae]|uniref:Uncharacterized protein n=1 Tax=Roseibium algae TaxID=3123038 RepID=A0ABU8TIR2_9HYPH
MTPLFAPSSSSIRPSEAGGIITTATEAKLFLHQREYNETIISLAPDASVLLRQAGHDVLELEDVITGFTHARILVRATAYLDTIETRLLNLGWYPGEIEAVRIFLFNFIPPLLLLQKALATCSKTDLSIVIDGALLSGQSRDDAFQKLAEQISGSFGALLPRTQYNQLHARFCHLANRLILKLIGSRPTIYQLDHATPFTWRVSNLLADGRPDTAIVSVRHPGKTLIASLRRTLKSLAAAASNPQKRKEIRLFRASSLPRPVPVQASSLPCMIDGAPILDEAIRRGIAKYLPRIQHDNDAGAQLAQLHQPNVVVLDHLIQPSVIRAAQDFAERGIPSIMINHGSDTFQANRLANLGAALWARHGRLNMPGLDTLLCKSPLTSALPPVVLKNAPAIQAINIGTPYRQAETKGSDFLVVMAGNYRELHGHVPFVSETPGEYLRGLLEFARAAAQVGGLRLLIKLKPKKTGLPLDWLAETLSGDEFNGQVQVDTATPFKTLFETMDLLVGNNSATLQEALDNKVPLFLNTWRRQYCHFPARMTPPEGRDRAAAYAVKHADDLVPMLSAIRDCHEERLSSAELSGLVWKPEDLSTTHDYLSHALDPQGG